jgi:acetoin utilization protein AcuB
MPQMLIENWMTRRAVTVKPLDSIGHVREIFERERINQLPVVLNGRVVGIITDRDVRDAFPSVFDFTELGTPKAGHEVVDPTHIAVESVMSSNVVTLGPKQSVFEAARLMRKQRIGALPIVDHERLVGVLTRSDLLNALLTLGEQFGVVE